MTNKLGVAVVGLGYWGPKVVRNVIALEGCDLTTIYDVDRNRAERIVRAYPSIEIADSWDQILSDHRVHALIVATPVSTHYELARSAIVRGKDVLVEKPLAQTPTEARHLVDLAIETGRVLMVGHTYVYSDPVKKVKALLDEGEIGEPLYVDSVRANLGVFRSDVNVLYDLATHDLSILDRWISEPPVAVRCIGVQAIRGQPESLAYVSLFYESGLIAHIHANWLSPVKIRRTMLGGSRRMVVYDDTEAVERVKLFDSGIAPAGKEEVDELRIRYRTGDIWSPRLEDREPLSAQCAHFLDCVRSRSQPLTDGSSGLRVVCLLHAAQASLQAGGEEVRVSTKDSLRVV